MGLEDWPPLVRTLIFAGTISAAVLFAQRLRDPPPSRPSWKSYGKGYVRSLEDIEREAAHATPGYIWSYVQYHAGHGLANRRLQESFERVLLNPRVMRDVSGVDLGVSLFGRQYAHPIGIAPTGFHALMHADGEEATARAAAATHALYVYNYMYSNVDAGVVGPASAGAWMQIYLFRDRSISLQAVRDAERFGFAAIVLTCDHPHDRVRDANMPLFAIEGDHRFLTTRLHFPNAERHHRMDDGPVGEIDRTLTWADVTWLTQQTKLPIVCKGITCVEDARLAVQHGAQGIIVSNHGGRQFDAAPSPLDSLPSIVAAVGSDVPVLFDSGVRSGTHAAKAIALGATAVLVGRPIMWGLLHGVEGVSEVIKLLRADLEADMQSLGCCRLAALREHLV